VNVRATASRVRWLRIGELFDVAPESVVRMVARAGIVWTGVAYFILVPLLASALGLGLEFVSISDPSRLLLALAAILAMTVCGYLCFFSLAWFEEHQEWYPHVALGSVTVWGLGAILLGAERIMAPLRILWATVAHIGIHYPTT
jgi:hypothetical protein